MHSQANDSGSACIKVCWIKLMLQYSFLRQSAFFATSDILALVVLDIRIIKTCESSIPSKVAMRYTCNPCRPGWPVLQCCGHHFGRPVGHGWTDVDWLGQTLDIDRQQSVYPSVRINGKNMVVELAGKLLIPLFCDSWGFSYVPWPLPKGKHKQVGWRADMESSIDQGFVAAIGQSVFATRDKRHPEQPMFVLDMRDL